MNHGEGQENKLNFNSVAHFIEIPEKYSVDQDSTFNVRYGTVRHFQFDGTAIHFDHLHLQIKRIEPSNAQYHSIKSLVDMLQ